jgi:hypothetical protein
VSDCERSGRDAGRAEDLQAVFGRRPHDQFHVGRRWRTGRELRAGGGLGERADEAREVARFGDQEEPCDLGAHDERVRDVAWAEDERAGWCDVGLAVAITGAIARGIRTSLRFDAARRINGLEAPGLVVLGPGDEVELITPPARELLASIAANDLPYADDDMPAAVLSLAGFVRSAPHAAQAGRTSSRCPPRTVG